MQGTPNTQITLQQFIGIKDSNGAFKVWTDITQTEWKENLVNQEILGAPIYLTKAKDMIGDNVPLEMPVIPGVYEVDLTNPPVAKPRLMKLIANLSRDYWAPIVFDIRDKKSSIEWSKMVGAWSSGQWKRKSDTDNLIGVEALTNTCLAFGRYIINPVVGGKGYSKEDYYDASMILVDEADEIVSLRTDYQLGSPTSNVKVIGSYTANKNQVIGQNFISAANLSLEKYSSGQPGQIMGYDTARTIYLGKKVFQYKDGDSKKEQQYPRDFDFTNFSALIYQLDSFRAYGHAYEDTAYPINDYNMRYSKNWRINAIVYPGFEPLNLLVVNRAPTLEEVNAARAQLRNEQPGIYFGDKALPDIDQETLDQWNVQNDRFNSRVVIKNFDGSTEISSTSLLNNGSANVKVDITAQGATRKLSVESATIRGMSFDLSSVKAYGGLNISDITIEPISLNEISLTSAAAIKSGYFTIDVLRDNKKYGVVFVKIETEAARAKKVAKVAKK